MDDKLVNSIANYVLQLLGEENKRIPQLKNRLRSIVQGIDNLLDAIQNGLLTDAMRTRLEKLEIDKKEVEKQIEEEELQRPIITKKQILAFIKKFRDTDPNDLNACKKMIDVFINRIYLYDDKILITYNYNSENHTITLDDANDAIDSNLDGPSAPKREASPCEVLLFLAYLGVNEESYAENPIFCRRGATSSLSVRRSSSPRAEVGFSVRHGAPKKRSISL